MIRKTCTCAGTRDCRPAFDATPLSPVERVSSRMAVLADTLSFTFRAISNAKPGSVDGRPGDVRNRLWHFQGRRYASSGGTGHVSCLAGSGKPTPQSYQSPIGEVNFANVAPLSKARLKFVMDSDGKGFVLVAGSSASAIPGLPRLSGDVRTMVNFEATFAGHNKFWWANSDGSASRETYDEPSKARLYPGSWAPAQFQQLEDGLLVRNWLVCGPFGGPGAEKFIDDRGPPRHRSMPSRQHASSTMRPNIRPTAERWICKLSTKER